ncbi:MAG: hypothetical protein M1818_004706 [Claussenomyces sp. TS43310]|nr:MAG: hypothetical protein M1818_004706 [Claussenomyces sp. TS43310]
MPTRVSEASDETDATAFHGGILVSQIPPALRFPLLVTLSLCSSSLLYSCTSKYTAGELASVSRSLNAWWEVGALVGWKTFELGLGWYCNYDSYDLAALSLLSHGPPLYLLGVFYEIRPITVFSALVIDVLTTYLPFRLLRPLSPAHAVSTSSRSLAVLNRDVVTDLSIQTLTAIFAASIYSVTLFTAYLTYLPVTLVTHFNDIPTIAPAHSASIVTLLPLSLVLGLAARSFIFTPAVASAPSLAMVKKEAFNPATATLAETFKHNVWSFNARTKTVITRTTTLMLVTGVNTAVQCFMTIEGVEAVGAIAYAAVWVTAAAVTGASLGLVGAV